MPETFQTVSLGRWAENLTDSAPETRDGRKGASPRNAIVGHFVAMAAGILSLAKLFAFYVYLFAWGSAPQLESFKVVR